MTEDQLAEIKARASAATPGPWDTRKSDAFYEVIVPLDNNYSLTEKIVITEDAQFIAHARTDIPSLIARIRELEKQLANARAVRAWEVGGL